MTESDKIEMLIREGEGLTIKFKERYTPRIDREIVAFANSKGGLLLLGVDDRGKVVGENLTNKRRNPIIADLFHRMDKVERMGSGIKRMRNLMRDAGLQEPVFEMDSFFRVTFYRDPRYSLKAEKVGGKGTEETTQKTTQKIIEAITKKADITQKELAALIGITEDGVKYHITRLKRKGILKRVGPAKGGHWEIVE